MESENKIFHDIREIIIGEVCRSCPCEGLDICVKFHQKRCYGKYDVQATKISKYVKDLLEEKR